MLRKIIVLFAMCIAQHANAENFEKDLKEAQILYDSIQEKIDEAKNKYLYLANKGCAEACFILAYRFSEGYEYYFKAAELGSVKGLDYAIDYLEHNYLDAQGKSNYTKALDLYNRTINVTCSTSEDQEEFKNKRNYLQFLIELYQDAGDFDFDGFLQKYGLKEDSNNSYFFWELAEDASQTDRFGKPDPKLILQLVLLGGHAQLEWRSAVYFAYANFKKGIVKPFVIDEYITSGYGMYYCVARKEKNYKAKDKEDFEKINFKLNAEGKKLFDEAIKSAQAFIESKAMYEEGYGGSGYRARALESYREAFNKHKDFIGKLLDGKLPKITKISLKKANKNLKNTYKKVFKLLNSLPQDSNFGGLYSCYENITLSDFIVKIKENQKKWLKYRDSSALLFSTICPSISNEQWLVWLTQHRVQGLEALYKRYKCEKK